jgi:hypothetical protein
MIDFKFTRKELQKYSFRLTPPTIDGGSPRMGARFRAGDSLGWLNRRTGATVIAQYGWGAPRRRGRDG